MVVKPLLSTVIGIYKMRTKKKKKATSKLTRAVMEPQQVLQPAPNWMSVWLSPLPGRKPQSSWTQTPSPPPLCVSSLLIKPQKPACYMPQWAGSAACFCSYRFLFLLIFSFTIPERNKTENRSEIQVRIDWAPPQCVSQSLSWCLPNNRIFAECRRCRFVTG